MGFHLKKIRKNIPWHLKFGLKLIRGSLPISYNFFAKLGLFRHGKMDHPRNAVEVFNRHFPNPLEIPLSPFVFLEIGPGDSLFSGIIASFKGAKASYLIDSGDFISKDIEQYLKLIELLFGVDYLRNCNFFDLEDINKHFNIHYMTNGLESIRSLPEHSVDLSFSNACFEHINADEILDFFIEIKRVSKPNGISSHCIDFKDHLAYSLNNLRFSRISWEKEIIKKSGIYTNRMRCSDMVTAAEKAGWNCKITSFEKWETLPIGLSSLNQEFRSYKMDDLLVKVAWLRLT